MTALPFLPHASAAIHTQHHVEGNHLPLPHKVLVQQHEVGLQQSCKTVQSNRLEQCS